MNLYINLLVYLSYVQICSGFHMNRAKLHIDFRQHLQTRSAIAYSSLSGKTMIFMTNMNDASVLKSYVDSRKSIKVGKHEILSFESEKDPKDSEFENKIYLEYIKYGWGDGKHPTTKLCLDFLDDYLQRSSDRNIKLLDYGTGSGILSIYAAKMNVEKCLGVEIDEASILSAAHNVALNGVSNIVEIIHTARIYIGNEELPTFDLTIANILPGALTRLVGVIWGLTKPGGTICLSGMRPKQLEDIRKIYGPYVDLSTETVASASHEMFGDWVRWTVKSKVMTDDERRDILVNLNDLATP